MKKCKNAGFSLPAELMEHIDKDRGDVSRSRYVLRILEKAYTKEEEMVQQLQGQRVCGSNPQTAEAKG